MSGLYSRPMKVVGLLGGRMRSKEWKRKGSSKVQMKEEKWKKQNEKKN